LGDHEGQGQTAPHHPNISNDQLITHTSRTHVTEKILITTDAMSQSIHCCDAQNKME